ncbi:WD40-repeat-containing domain protein [Chytriomyces sp. MP71]|nr:WD40-repeat-containing domain protein [Chytriomyces sp. MP71]
MGKRQGDKRTFSANVAAPNPSALGKIKKTKKGRLSAVEAAKVKAQALDKDISQMRERMRVIADRNKDDEEADLEALVFGGARTSIAGLAQRFGAAAASASATASTGSSGTEDADAMDGTAEDDGDGEELFVIDRRAPKLTVSGNDGEGTDDDDEDPDRIGHDDEAAAALSAGRGGNAHSEESLWTDAFGDDGAEFAAVDIANGSSRLRKLREHEDEKTISPREFEERLRKTFVKLHPTPTWALNPDPALVDPDSWAHSSVATVLRSAKSMIDRSMRRRLPHETIEMFRVKDANQASPSAAVIQSCKFHPSAPVLLTAGYDRTLRLFHVDGKVNPKIQSVYIKDMPIHSADFTADGRQIVACGRRKFFYVYDVEGATVERVNGIRGRDEKSFEQHTSSPCGKFLAFTGRDGYIILVSRISKQWIANLRMNGTVRALDFSKDGRWLFSVGGDGEVYQWDLATRQCVHKFYDEGAVKVNTIAVSPDNSYIATGSSAGIVNVYSSSSALSSDRPTPSRALMNLTTSISTLAFHPSSQALLFASRTKKDSMKIAHCPSLTVFQNWPTANTPLGYVNTVDWSPGGGYLATGNDKGKVLLYRATAFDSC